VRAVPKPVLQQTLRCRLRRGEIEQSRTKRQNKDSKKLLRHSIDEKSESGVKSLYDDANDDADDANDDASDED
jgi:hypothetical protein